MILPQSSWKLMKNLTARMKVLKEGVLLYLTETTKTVGLGSPSLLRRNSYISSPTRLRVLLNLSLMLVQQGPAPSKSP